MIYALIAIMVVAAVLAVAYFGVKSKNSKLASEIGELEKMVEKLNSDLDISSQEYKNLKYRNGQLVIKTHAQEEKFNAQLAALQKE